jgi:CheY-like chemotaxis protein
VIVLCITYVSRHSESMDAMRVLVVEDDRDLREALETTLSGHGFDVSLAANGAEAIEMLEAGYVPSGVIVDLLMPGVVGQELLEYLRAEPTLANVRVVIATGSPHLAPAGYTVLAKPVDVARLLGSLRGDDDVANDNDRGARDVRARSA